jgi:Lon-like protease
MLSKVYTRTLIIGSILAIILSFIQLPYYVTKPGMAQELEPIIEVEDGYDEEGSFMLTTVRMGKANIYSYLWAKVNDYHYLYPTEEIRREGESDDEYTYRQLHLMENSQESAISIAYEHANKEYDFVNHGVYVVSVVPDMPAEKELKPGDRIFKVDEREFTSADEFIDYVSQKQEGSSIELTFEREGSTKVATLPLKSFSANPEKVGIGIALVTDREINTDPKISIDTESIGGPSAGLMFSLEIYNQLTKDDMTRGLTIAGTGSIDDDGNVGRIGGISQKIVAADKTGVKVFFAPNEEGKKGSNYEEALKTAKEIKSEMKIVPVDTFYDALEYLENLPNKES